MARFDYLNDKPKNKPKWYDKPKPRVVPKKQEQIWDEPGAGPAFWQTNNTAPEFGYVPTGPTKPVPWQNQYPAWMRPPVNKPVSQKSGAGGFRFADPNAPKIISQGQPMPATFLNQTRQADTGDGNLPWQNQYPAWMKPPNRPAYFNNRSTPAEFNRWLDSFEQPEKAIEAIELIEKEYQQYKADKDAIMAANENLYDKPTPKTYLEWMGSAGFGDAIGEALGIGWEDPEIDLETVFGRRYSQELAEKKFAYPPDNTNKFLTDYQSRVQAREEVDKVNQLEEALIQASPFFLPITDELGNVLAPAPLTPKEYADGVTDGKIYDPNMPDSLPQYGKTQLVIEDGQLIPYEMWYRAKTDQMGLFGGNWNLPMFSDTEGYQYNTPGMNFQGNQMRWLDIQNFVNLKNFENKTNKGGVKTDGTMGQPGQAMPFGFNPGIDFQIPNQIHSGTEMVEDPNLGEDPGPGYWGVGGGGGYGPSYWGNTNSSGYYGNTSYGPNNYSNPNGGYGGGYAGNYAQTPNAYAYANANSPFYTGNQQYGPNVYNQPNTPGYIGNANYGPGYWGVGGGGGYGGYSGSNSYNPNYQNNQYGLRKGQYFSQLARWVI